MATDPTTQTLMRLYNERAELGLDIWQAERDTDAELLSITPAEGWPGKNPEQRETARQQAMHASAIINAATHAADKARARQMIVAGQIEALEAERRAGEWQIRARLVEVLERRNIAPNGRGDRAEAAFDDVALAEAEAEMPF